MVITSVKISVFPESNSKMKAVASIVIDGAFVVNNIKILYSNERFFLAMPSKPKRQGGFMDVAHPINEAVRKLIEAIIMFAYNKAIDNDTKIVELTSSDYAANIFEFDPNNYELTVLETEQPKKIQANDTKKKATHVRQDDNWQKWFNS